MTVSLSERRQVGRTKLSVQPFGLGTAHLGELYYKIDEPDARATLDAAWDNGVRFYDTAPWYGRGLSEHRVGGYLRSKPRGEFVLTTKVGRTLHRPKDPATFNRAPWTGGLNFQEKFDYSYDGVMRSYEQQLQRLGMDTVDALFIHDLDESFHGDKTAGYMRELIDGGGMRALHELKSAGDIKAVGMGINTASALENIATSVDIDVALVAMPYTLLNQESLDTGMATCVKRGVSVIIGAPFASGVLVTGSTGNAHYNYLAANAEVLAKVRGLEAACAKHKVSLPAAALQFVLAHPAVVAVIPGAMKSSEVVQNLASVQAPIPGAFWADLKAEGLIVANAPVPAGA